MGTKTYAQLTAQTDVDDGDLLAIWRSSPLKRITASILKDYFSGGVVRSARTANTVLLSADKAKLIDITSGTFSQTFDAAATLGDGWWVYIRNSGTGTITLNPDGTEQIDGLTSYAMHPGEMRLVTCTGTAFFTVVIQPFYKTFTATDAAFMWPPGYQAFQGFGQGDGGGGGRGNTTTPGGGGGGGPRTPFTIQSSEVTAGATVAVTIGTGGLGATTNNTNGATGSGVTIGSLRTFYGGAGGNANGTGGGGGGALGNGDTNGGGGAPANFGTTDPLANPGFGGGGGGLTGSITGASSAYGGGGGGCQAPATGTGGAGGRSLYGGGGGGGGGGSAGSASAGGTSVYAGAGGTGGFNATAGGNGSAPGGGGGGGGSTGAASANGGNGARGEVIMWGVV